MRGGLNRRTSRQRRTLMTRVAFVSSVFPTSSEPHLGIFNYRRAAALQHLAEIEVFCPLPSFPRWKFLQPRSYDYHPADPDYRLPDVRVQYVRYPAVAALSRPFNGSLAARALLPRIERMMPDVILAYWLYPDGFAAVQVGRRLGIPTVVVAMGGDLNWIPDHDPITRWLVCRTLRGASFVITVSEELRQRAIGYGVGIDRLRTVRNGCDSLIFHRADRSAARLRLGIPAACELLLFVGRLDPLKGVAEFLEAGALLGGSRPHLQLALVGEGPAETDLRARAGQADLAGRVLFLGKRDQPEIASWLAACNLLVLPSYMEGCPNAVLEALACGRPVVATNVGGVPELTNESCSILVQPRDSHSLAAGINQTLSRSWDEAAIALRCARTWHDVARETFEVCQAACGRRASAQAGL